ncbi:MAG: 4Fe-4S binding protein [Wenzhouxiangella sp.]
MSDSFDLTRLLATTPTGQARAAALAEFDPPPEPMEWVEYQSSGRLLIIGPSDEAWAIADQLKAHLSCTVLATEPPTDIPDEAPPVKSVDGRPHDIEGWMGQFTLKVEVDRGRLVDAAAAFGIDPGSFDLILNLDGSADPGMDLPPLGYFRAQTPEARARALCELPELVGEFQKPRFFAYEPDICAHGSRGLNGCNACIDACATGAAISIGETVQIDPYLCQGCGSCVTVCPTGAMSYAAPSAEDLLDSLRRLVGTFYQSSSDPVAAPDLLFFGAETGLDDGLIASLPEQVLPVAVEDVGSVGPDTWLSLLSYGVGRVLLLTGANPSPTLVDATRRQIRPYTALLEGLGDARAGERVQMLTGSPDLGAIRSSLAPVVSERGSFAAIGTKREILRQALNHLHRHAAAAPEVLKLPAPAPFGTIHVSGEACTLCMACVSVCPVSAIQGGGDLPELHFRESACVQCGVCEQACPEDAIRLERRIHFGEHRQPSVRLLHQEALHHCPGCGKPFATQRMMDSMAERLKGHWMFQNEEALARIRLCEDCRVVAIYADESGIEVHHAKYSDKHEDPLGDKKKRG